MSFTLEKEPEDRDYICYSGCSRLGIDLGDLLPPSFVHDGLGPGNILIR